MQDQMQRRPTMLDEATQDYLALHPMITTAHIACSLPWYSPEDGIPSRKRSRIDCRYCRMIIVPSEAFGAV